MIDHDVTAEVTDPAVLIGEFQSAATLLGEVSTVEAEATITRNELFADLIHLETSHEAGIVIDGDSELAAKSLAVHVKTAHATNLKAQLAMKEDELTKRLEGRRIRVKSADPTQRPVRSYYWSSGLAGTHRHERSTRNYHSVTGTVRKISLFDNSIRIKPRAFSTLRLDYGYFEAPVIDTEGNPLIEIEFRG